MLRKAIADVEAKYLRKNNPHLRGKGRGRVRVTKEC